MVTLLLAHIKPDSRLEAKSSMAVPQLILRSKLLRGWMPAWVSVQLTSLAQAYSLTAAPSVVEEKNGSSESQLIRLEVSVSSGWPSWS